MDSGVWQTIRSLRARPVGAAVGNDDRRRTFVAALRQAEELARSAEVASYATRPLPLFYSLSQAGRAIAAAHSNPHWALKGHGLSCKGGADVLAVQLKPNHSQGNSFDGVASAIGSPRLAGSVSLAELWAANPDLLDVPFSEELAVSRSLIASLHSPSHHRHDAAHYFQEFDNKKFSGGDLVFSLVDLPGVTAGEVENRMSRYPSVRDCYPVKGDGSGKRAVGDDPLSQSVQPDGQTVTNIGLTVPSPYSFRDVWLVESRICSVIEKSPTVDSTVPVGLVLPELGGGEAPLPLMLWWGLLYVLSSMARYEPAVWTEAVDLDVSPLASSLEQVIDRAERYVPLRVLRALNSETSFDLAAMADAR